MIVCSPFSGLDKGVIMPIGFGSWLAENRERRGLSVRSLATRAGVSHATVSKVEDGLVGASRDMVVKLCKALLTDDTDGDTAQELVNSGLVAAGFLPEGAYVTYTQDPAAIPVPEGYGDLDDPFIRAAAESAATEAYKSVVDALRKARMKSPGTIGYGKDRYEEDKAKDG